MILAFTKKQTSPDMGHEDEADGSQVSDSSSDEEVYEDAISQIENSDPNDAIGISASSLPMSKRKEIEQYNHIMTTLDDEFRSDLALHLYALHNLHTQNRYVPGKSFGEWPLPPEEVPKPLGDLTMEHPSIRYTKFLDIHNKKGMKHPLPYMMKKFAAKIDSPVIDLMKMLDLIYERKVVQRINDYNSKHSHIQANGKRITFQPVIDHHIRLPKQIRLQLLLKLDSIIDKLIKYKRKQVINTLQSVASDELVPLFDWHTVSSMLTDINVRNRLRYLFSLYYDKSFTALDPLKVDLRNRMRRYDKYLTEKEQTLENLDEAQATYRFKKEKFDDSNDLFEQVLKCCSNFVDRDRLKSIEH